MSEPADQPWYKEGLRFTCTQCGNCCTGAPGFVWVNQEELDQLSAATGQTVEQFTRRYVRQVGKRQSLLERPNGDCVFYERGVGCTVYEHRPRQCRSWPFWDSNLGAREDWEETCRICPGSGSGRLYSIGEIEEQRNLIHL